MSDRYDETTNERIKIINDNKETRISTNSSIDNDLDIQENSIKEKWNSEYLLLVKANIRQSVDAFFSNYVSEEKLEQCLETLTFMDQNELTRLYMSGGGIIPNGILGFNDAKSSNIAFDRKGVTSDGYVGNNQIQGSRGFKINFAFVTAIHENLHMMSANDQLNEIRRGIMVGNDEKSRAMNEAFTEYFTFISCGGDEPFGGMYPGIYSAYHNLMKEMPIIEKAIGREYMMEAYFKNKPEIIRDKIDSILGNGAWDNMCYAAYDILYNDKAVEGVKLLNKYLDLLKQQ
ncbi:MAG: hypothetical protein IJI41_03165 [Anaerolineaceae bacterium]|nr:hypothetical protein [Anaerolineaceae bacterium]